MTALTAGRLVQYRGVTASMGADANNAAVSPALPTGWAVGDLHLLIGHFSTAAGSLATPDGWTLIKTLTASRDKNKNYFYTRIARTGDTAPTLTPSGGSAGEGVFGSVVGFWNYNWNNPISLFGADANNDTSADVGPIVPPDTQHIRNGALVVFASRYYGYTQYETLTGDGLTWTEVIDYSSGGVAVMMGLDIGVWPANTRVDVTNKTMHCLSGTGTGCGIMFVVNGIGDGITGWIIDDKLPKRRRRILPPDRNNIRLSEVIYDSMKK